MDTAGHQSVLLVTGHGSYQKSGAEHLLRPLLAGRHVTRVVDFETNPKKEDLLRILNKTQEDDYSVIIAVGGGSVIDVAKLIKCFRGHPEQVDQVIHQGGEASPSRTDLWVLPTTAGSGAEATHFAVLYDQGVKFSVAHRRLMPDAVWILPSLLATVPKDVAAAAAMDAFCQGVESYWSIHSTPESQEWAKQAILLAWEHMLSAVHEKNAGALGAMARAAYLAGQAINITKTTAPHAISYAFTAHFGILHGHAVSLTLPAIFQFNDGVKSSDIQDSRGVDYVKSTLLEICCMLGCSSSREAAGLIVKRMGEIGLSANLNDLGLRSSGDREMIIEDGCNPQRMSNNPRIIEAEDLREILDSMLGD